MVTFCDEEEDGSFCALVPPLSDDNVWSAKGGQRSSKRECKERRKTWIAEVTTRSVDSLHVCQPSLAASGGRVARFVFGDEAVKLRLWEAKSQPQSSLPLRR